MIIAFMPLEALHRAVRIPMTVATPRAPPAPEVTCLSCSPMSSAVDGESILVSSLIWFWTVAGSATSP